MLRKISDISYHEFSAICKNIRYKNKGIINKCKDCPALIHVGAARCTCYYACKQVVDKHANDMVDDGTIPDEDLPYWFN